MTFTYCIGKKFNLAGFLTAMRADGIRLQGTIEDPSVNGYADKTDGIICVCLFDSDNAAHHFVRLKGNLANYKNSIDLRIAQYDIK